MRLRLLFVLLSLALAIPAVCQVTPHAERQISPIAVGVGFSNYYTDWSRYESGPAVWLDWNFYNLPPVLNGLGVEIEGRDLNYHRTGDIPNLRESTIGGGVIYTFHQIPISNFHFYGKYLIEYGRADIASPALNLAPQTATNLVHAPGAGIEIRTWRDLWLRGEYEWQFWPQFPNVAPHTHALSPNGFTIGASYRLPIFRLRTR